MSVSIPAPENCMARVWPVIAEVGSDPETDGARIVKLDGSGGYKLLVAPSLERVT